MMTRAIEGTIDAGNIVYSRDGAVTPRRLSWSACIVVIALSLMPCSLWAASTDLETQVREIAQQLRCPVCQGLSVSDSPSELAHEMRAVVREQLQQGKTRQEILDYFVQRYGEWILLAPPKRGFNLVIWFLPFVLLPAGALAVYAGTRRWVRNRQAVTPPSAALDPRYAERLQRELDSYT
ncbi:MAG TPA: cytochrome c-type biogenesis protein [Alphaproteobacteria bacterium]|nr:cytochrome c-type biogenesis protein [Alphaproteobacteria bacterium]